MKFVNNKNDFYSGRYVLYYNTQLEEFRTEQVDMFQVLQPNRIGCKVGGRSFIAKRVNEDTMWVDQNLQLMPSMDDFFRIMKYSDKYGISTRYTTKDGPETGQPIGEPQFVTWNLVNLS